MIYKNIMPILSFHCTFGALAYSNVLSLLVWAFEIPPSKINISGCRVDVPLTPTTIHTYINCIKYGSYKFTAPKIISSSFGVVLRQFTAPTPDFSPDQTGYKMLCAMAGGHKIDGKQNKDNTWDMSTGLGYRNTGIRYPITATGAFKLPADKSGIGFNGHSTRMQWEPIQFVPATK